MPKKSSRRTTTRSSAKRSSSKQRSSLLSRFRNSRNAKLLAVALIFGAIGTYFVVNSYADTTVGIHIAPKATNLNTSANGPRVVEDSTAQKKNVKSVYVARSSGGAVNQVSVPYAIKKGTYEVCAIGRPLVTGSTGKLRVSDKPYGTDSALTIETAFKSTPTTEYVGLACPIITIPNDMTIYLSHVVTQGSYNFSIDAVKSKKTPPASNGNLPTPDTTGYKHTGVALKSCEQYASGSSYIIRGTSAGTVVDGCDFLNKQVRIEGGGPVTLKRSRVRNASNCDAACAAVLVAKGAGPVVIEDVEITTTNPSVTNESQRQDRSIGIFKGNTQPVTIRRVYAHDTTRGADITGQNNISFIDSYMAYNVSPPSNGNCGQERKHSSAVRAAGGVYNVLFKNTVLGIGDCSFASGILAFYPENGANHDITIDGGMWIIQGNNSGGYGIAAGYTKPQPTAKPPVEGEKQNYNFTVKNLQISTQYNSNGCPSGCSQNWNQQGDPKTNPIGPLGGTKVWENVTKYNPGKSDHGQQINP